MATDRDDDDAALVWAGDEPTKPAQPAPRVEPVETSPPRTPRVDPVETSPPKTQRVEPVETSPPKTPVPAPLLITYGVLGGLYLIYTIGWVLTVSQGAPARASVFDDIMLRVQQGLAVASPAIWFGAVFLLTRGRKPLVRLLWLLVGLAIVIPWPTVLGV